MMHWFIAHHTDVAAMVLALDERWCVTDPALPVRTPFPFWLYSDSDLVYLSHAMSTRSLRDSFRRVAAAFGSPPSVDPAGYADYEMGKAWSFKPGRPATADEFPVGDGRSSPRLPGIDPARCRARRNPGGDAGGDRDAAAVLYAAAARRHAGRAIPRRLQGPHRATHPRGAGSAFIDFLVNSEIARAPENFMDDEHYRTNVARIIEADVAGALGTRREASGRD